MSTSSGVDRRRVRASVSYVPGPADDQTGQVEGKGIRERENDRKDHVPRPAFLKLGLVTQARGSVYCEAGRVKVICAVQGPYRERSASSIGEGKIHVEVKRAPFAGGRAEALEHVGAPSTLERTFASCLHQALAPVVRLDLFPKTSLAIHVQILEMDGEESTLAWAITAASLALVDARIDVLGMVVGCALVYVNPEHSDKSSTPGRPRLLVDPDLKETEAARAKMTLAMYPAPAHENHLTLMEQTGRLETMAELQEAIELAKGVTRDLHRWVLIPALKSTS